MTNDEVNVKYRSANNAGYGYEMDGETVEEAVAQSGGYVVVASRTSDDVTVVRVGPQLIAIGGDAMGRNPWACDIDESVSQ